MSLGLIVLSGLRGSAASKPVLGGARDRLLVLEGHTVDDVQRVVARADRRAAADADLHAGAGLAVVRHHLHARDAALDKLVRVRDDAFVGVFGVDLRNGAGDRLASLAAVAGDDHFAEGRGDGDQREVRGRGGARAHRDLLFLRAESDASHPDSLRAGGDALQKVAAVEPRETTDLRADNLHLRVRDRLLCRGINDSAGYTTRALGAQRAT